MGEVISDTEFTFYQCRDPSRGPNISFPTELEWTFQQVAQELVFLSAGESGRSSGRSEYSQTFLAMLVPSIAPSHDGAGIAFNTSRDFVERKVLLEQLDSFLTTSQDDFGWTFWSHGEHPSQGARSILHY